jgi:hypothetical protein
MTNWPGTPPPPPPPGGSSGWVDPDAPTGLAPQHQRSQPSGWQQPQQPPAEPPPWPAQNQPPPPGLWPHQQPQPPWPVYPGAGGPPPKNRRRTPLIVGLIAAAVVVIVVAVLAIKVLGGSDNISASDTVKGYLEALSAGDAAKALSYGAAQPANSDLLTDEILKKQLARMPITNIRILDEDTSMLAIGMTMVHAAASFGSVVDDVELRLKKDADGNWKLETAAIKIDPPPGADSNLSAKTVTIFGRSFDKGSLYAFPGYLGIGSTNRYLKATAEPLLLQHLSSYSAAWLSPQISLNDDGRAAIQQSLVDAFANCQKSQSLAPPNCPGRVTRPDAVEGTASWGQADLSGVTIGDLSAYSLSVILGGKAQLPLGYKLTDGGMDQGMASVYVGGTADISKSPPMLNLR